MKKLLLQLDTDPYPSAFDQVAAYDSGIDHVISYGNITSESAQGLVHGIMFPRPCKELSHSAIFLGGSDISANQQVIDAVKKCFSGSVRVSVMLDPGGFNTTAAALVRKVVKNYDVRGKKVVILAGANPVGQRCALFLLKEGADEVILASQQISRSTAAAKEMQSRYEATITPAECCSEEEAYSVLEGAHVAIIAAPPETCFLPKQTWFNNPSLEIMVNNNTAPPLGIEGMEITDEGMERAGKRFYGAITIINLKMKIHRRGIASLFESNDQLLDEIALYDLACEVDK